MRTGKGGQPENDDWQIYCCRRCPWGPASAYPLRAACCRLPPDPEAETPLGDGCDWPRSGVRDPHCSSLDWTRLERKKKIQAW